MGYSLSNTTVACPPYRKYFTCTTKRFRSKIKPRPAGGVLHLLDPERDQEEHALTGQCLSFFTSHAKSSSVSRGGFGCSNTPLCVTTPPLPSRKKDTLLYSIVGDGRYHKLCRFSGRSRGAKEPLFSVASLVHRVEAAVAHCAVKYCGCCKMCSGRRASLTLDVSVARR